MAVFSVYDYDRRQFDYYQTPSNVTHQSLGSVKFSSFRQTRKTKGETNIGSISEAMAFPLPPGAKKIGEGEIPRGVIATLGEVGFNPVTFFKNQSLAVKIIAVAGVSYVFWRVMTSYPRMVAEAHRNIQKDR